MNSNLLGWGIALAVVGAILKYAVADNFIGVDLSMIGLIALLAGVLLAVLGLIPRKSTVEAHTQHVDTATGQATETVNTTQATDRV